MPVHQRHSQINNLGFHVLRSQGLIKRPEKCTKIPICGIS
jgi:hypothetical protein